MNKKIITLAVSTLAMTFMTGCNNAGGIDKDIKLFYDGIDVKVPSLNGYKLEYEVYYSYEYDDYAIEGKVKTSKALDDEYAKKFTKDTGFVSGNDDDYYPVEEYGYIFVDNGFNDEKVIAVVDKDPRFDHIHELSDITQHQKDEIKDFFQTYKTLQKIKVEALDFHDKEAARKRSCFL